MAKILIAILIFIFSSNLRAGSLEEVLRLNRCYAIMTQTRLPVDSPLLKKVLDGTLTGVKACMKLLDAASLSHNKIKDPKSNILGKKVLRSFQSFHNSWFSNFLTYMTDDSPLIYDLVELGEPGLFVTQALFNDQWDYRDILKGSESYRGVRQKEKKPYYLIGTNIDEKIPVKKEYQVLRGPKKDPITWAPTLLQRGEMVGVEKNILNRDVLPAHGHQLFFPTFYEEPLDIHKGLGGGFMGTNSYLLFNNGRPHGERSDGQIIMFRSYTKYLYRDILCRDLPVLSKKDARPFTRLNNDVSWSNSESCMSCHASLDPIASLLRNAELVINEGPKDGSSHLKFHKPKFSLPDTYKLYDKVKDYYLSKPEANFTYRDISGKYFHKKVSSLDELGLQMAKTKDFYACAASRYFYFLTGEELPITSLDIKNKKHRFLLNLAKDLESHQKTRKLIEKIISSDWFVN